MTSEAPQLEYAQRPRWHRRRRRVSIGIVLLVLALGVAAVAWFYGQAIRWRVNLVLAQRRAASGMLRPDQVVFEEDPARAAVDGSPGTIEVVYRRVGVMDVKVLDGPLSQAGLQRFAKSATSGP